MTRDFAKQQLARIQAFWPSLPGTSAAVDEFMRALGGYTEDEIDRGIGVLIDGFLEPSAPKLGHIKAAVRSVRPRTYAEATEEERDLHWAAHDRAAERQVDAEFEVMETWLAGSESGRAAYDAEMVKLLEQWPVERLALGRKVLHRAVLRVVYDRRSHLSLVSTEDAA